ncbi:hypothetical protein [Streptomyces sp. NPDC088762]|uniref:hypothetical protein n=1 Tax=Streptomyces sp. NPDC088762 TaxID=3365891 RepID=UPI00381A2F9E
MSGRQRRVCTASVIGAVLAGCAWWATAVGWPTVGLTLSVLAAVMLWESAWRSGAFHLPPRHPGGGRRLSGADADEERSLRLLAAADRAFDTGQGVRALGEEDSFERIVLLGVGWIPGRPYPPPGTRLPEA